MSDKEYKLNENELTVEERKKLSLEILDTVHDFCVKNNIRYFLHAGTLLGAVRHKGFIPWDDDLDICMPRPDYERFIKEFKVQGYPICFYKNTKKLCLPFIKVWSDKTYGKTPKGRLFPFGLGIDVFPIDGYPDSEKEVRKYFKQQDFIFHNFYVFSKSCEYPNIKGPNIIKNTIKYILKYTIFLFIKSPQVSHWLNQRAMKNVFSTSKTAGCSIALYRRKLEQVDRECFEKAILLPFEGKKYYCPMRYHEVLVSLYGENYMTPPPLESRNSEHLEHYFWKPNNSILKDIGKTNEKTK